MKRLRKKSLIVQLSFAIKTANYLSATQKLSL